MGVPLPIQIVESSSCRVGKQRSVANRQSLTPVNGYKGIKAKKIANRTVFHLFIILCLAFQGAQRKIDLFSAPFAYMFFVKFIRKDLYFLPAVRTFADKRLQVLQLFKTGAVLWCSHI